MKNICKTQTGFTLVELLISVSIIAILTSIFLGFGTMTTLKRGRDAKLRADLVDIQKEFEQYYSINGSYDTIDEMSVGLKKPIPTTPNIVTKAQGAYNTFCICATLEVDESGNSTNPDCQSYAEHAAYYCVGSVQEDYSPL